MPRRTEKRGRPRLEAGGISAHWAIRLPPSLAERIERLAKREGATRSDVLRRLVEKALGLKSKGEKR